MGLNHSKEDLSLSLGKLSKCRLALSGQVVESPPVKGFKSRLSKHRLTEWFVLEETLSSSCSTPLPWSGTPKYYIWYILKTSLSLQFCLCPCCFLLLHDCHFPHVAPSGILGCDPEM